MKRKRALIVDDDPAVAHLLSVCLKEAGWEVAKCFDGTSSVEWLRSNSADLVILDVLLPDVAGIELCTRVRDLAETRIIVVSAVDEPREKVRFLSAGADDYVTKPFSTAEFMARVAAVQRRSRTDEVATSPAVECGRIRLLRESHRVFVSGREIALTPTEFRILEVLMGNADKVLTHRQLLTRVWGPEYSGDRAYLHVFVGRLRLKVEEDPKRPRHILTVPRVGYRLVCECLGAENDLADEGIRPSSREVRR